MIFYRILTLFGEHIPENKCREEFNLAWKSKNANKLGRFSLHIPIPSQNTVKMGICDFEPKTWRKNKKKSVMSIFVFFEQMKPTHPMYRKRKKKVGGVPPPGPLAAES